MERLTEVENGTAMVKGCGSNCKYGFEYCRKEDWENCKTIDDVIDKLAQYEDLEDNGLLLRLPCKVGDTIYEVSYENREFVIKEHIVKEFIYRAYRFPRIEIYCENENGFLVCNNIGKLDECLFLTKAEAEKKLKEMESDLYVSKQK